MMEVRHEKCFDEINFSLFPSVVYGFSEGSTIFTETTTIDLKLKPLDCLDITTGTAFIPFKGYSCLKDSEI